MSRWLEYSCCLLTLLMVMAGCGGVAKNKALPQGERLPVFILEQPKLDGDKGWNFNPTKVGGVSGATMQLAGEQPDQVYNWEGEVPSYSKLRLVAKISTTPAEGANFVSANGQLCYLAQFNRISCLNLGSGKSSDIKFTVLSSHYHPRDYKGGGINIVANDKFVVTNGSNLIYAVEYNGNTAWSAQLPAILRDTPYVIGNRLVLVTTVENQLFALDAATGTLVWANESPKGDLASPSKGNIITIPSESGKADSVIWVNSSGEVARVNLANGEKMWSQNLLYNYELLPGTSLNYLTLGRLVSNKHVFLHDNEGNVYALHAENGQKLWQAYFGPIASWWVTDKEVLIVTDAGQFIALNAKDGKLLASNNISDCAPFQEEKPLMVAAAGKLYLLGNKLRWLEGGEWHSTSAANKNFKPIAVMSLPKRGEGGQLHIITSEGVYN